MRNYITVILITICSFSNAQIDKSTSDYKKGLIILEQTQKKVNLNNGKMNYSDCWNLALATALTERDKVKTFDYLLKSQQKDNSAFNDIVRHSIEFYGNTIENTPFYKLLGQQFIDLIDKSKIELSKNNNQKDLETKNIKNKEVIDILMQMMQRDQKYRKDKNFLLNKNLRNEQRKLDSINKGELTKLFNKYGYPGKSITGDNEFKNYTCLITEHGQDLKDQKKWLPIIALAYKKGELNANPLKMLLDRIHWQESNKQYFGSHTGVPFESDQEIERIKLKYEIE